MCERLFELGKGIRAGRATAPTWARWVERVELTTKAVVVGEVGDLRVLLESLKGQ